MWKREMEGKNGKREIGMQNIIRMIIIITITTTTIRLERG